MKIRLSIILLFLLSFQYSFAQIEKTVLLKTSTGDLEGTLLMPELNPSNTVALIIAGSGPTDRDGNNPMMKNNSLKMLTTELNKNGIASLRYDKRGIANSKSAALKEADLRFENNIDDAKGWVDYLKNELKFDNIVVIGHSEGSLIGMIASQDKSVSMFTSIAGAGRPADMIIREQIKNQPPFITTQVNSILDELVKGKTVENTPPELNMLFRQSVQPYLISWLKYDPQKEIAKLKIPVLIVQGTTDIQVSLDDANRLAKALPSAKLVFIEGMNHILKPAQADRQMNIATYTQPDLPIEQELIIKLISFISRKGE
jgi:pimeloyl-ACP methyl ester carboxylesterase